LTDHITPRDVNDLIQITATLKIDIKILNHIQQIVDKLFWRDRRNYSRTSEVDKTTLSSAIMPASFGIVNLGVMAAKTVITTSRIAISWWDSHRVSSETSESEQKSIHDRNQWKQTTETNFVTEKQQACRIFGKRRTTWQHKRKKIQAIITETI
jgi:hypothetical protein